MRETAERIHEFKEPRGIASLWFAVLAGPLAWMLGLTADYSLVRVACAKDAHMLPVGFTLQIMAFSVGSVVGWSSGTTGAVIAVLMAYDLVGPAPPKLLGADGGDATIALQIESSTMPPADWAGHDAYCFPTADSSCAGQDSNLLAEDERPSRTAT